MQGIKGMVAGFVAGLAFAAGAVFLMRDPTTDPSVAAGDIASLTAQVQSLERSVSELSALVATQARVSSQASETRPPGMGMPQASKPAPTPEQVDAIAAADALVDQGLQSGQWTRAQAAELHAVLAELDGAEGARIMARISAAINADQLQVELR